jgi:hypothetical protein
MDFSSYIQSINQKELFQKHFPVFQKFIKSFKKITFPAKFGFTNFSLKNLQEYFTNPACFELKLKREKGKNILYGLAHIQKRQKLFNNLPTTDQLAIILPKFEHYQLMPKILDFLFPKINTAQLPFTQLSLKIKDIGMGHSIYLINAKLPNQPAKRCVLKRESVINQSFYIALLNKLGYPSYKSQHINNHTGKWEIMAYLPGKNIAQLALKPHRYQRELQQIITQLPFYAALGDVLGVGDRHLENYLFSRRKIYPIDISYLFWQDNELWLEKYILGGLYEINILSCYADNPAYLAQQQNLFFKQYEQALLFLQKNQDIILKLIQHFFTTDKTDLPNKINFVTSRLLSPKDYFQRQKTRYLACFQQSLIKQKAKQKLEQEVKINPKILQDPWLKMYYYANKDRLACFYLAEEPPAANSPVLTKYLKDIS